MSTEPSLLAVSGATTLSAPLSARLARLAALGTRVRLVCPEALVAPDGVEVHRLVQPAVTPPSRVRRLLSRSASAAPPPRVPPSLSEELSEVTTVVCLAGGELLVEQLRDLSPTLPEVVGAGAAAQTLDTLTLDRELAVLHRLDELARARHPEDFRALAARLGPAAGTLVTSTRAALLVCRELTDGGAAQADVAARSTAALSAADQAWPQHPGAVYALSAAVRLLFHPVLHAEVAATPLAHDPDRFLAPLRGSRMFGEITSAAAHRPPAAAGEHLPGRPRRVMVLTGSYPRFAEPLVHALRADPELSVETVSLGERAKVLSWLGPNTRALALRVADHPDAPDVATLQARVPVDAGLFDGVDVVVAEWADRGAMWASTHLRTGVRLVLRCHGIDVMSPWAQLIDWDRVDDVVFVSAPLRDLARAVVGERLDRSRLHVVEHGVDADVFDRPAVAGRERVLGMIGWGRVVKDPCWTLDVLDALVEQDPSWRLLLVGHPLEPSAAHRAYAADLERRLTGPLGEHIDHVPQTDDVAAQAARMGFVISSSRRESFHLGLLEGVFAGAVPVVRDWPVYQGRTGPRGLFPADWVVPDPAAAAARISALADPTARAGVAARARAEAVEAFSQQRFDRHIRQVVLAGQG